METFSGISVRIASNQRLGADENRDGVKWNCWSVFVPRSCRFWEQMGAICWLKQTEATYPVTAKQNMSIDDMTDKGLANKWNPFADKSNTLDEACKLLRVTSED